jgi:hypothetical protein
VFDSFHGSSTFQAAPFVKLLFKFGEPLLAEQIALAAVDKSGGAVEDVNCVLEHLVPIATNGKELVLSMTNILKNKQTVTNDAVELIMNFYLQQGDQDSAFQAALLVPDQLKRLHLALPLASYESQYNDLKEVALIL